MTPVAKTGLHCGAFDPTGGEVLAEVTPVAKTGLHCGNVTGVAAADERWDVTPVAKTGLHCGNTRPRITFSWDQVTPVAKTGLHCGGYSSRFPVGIRHE